ncbi:MAG: hypothetical protein LC732_07510, partial [Acidobacteria bacterium]|nr:hypothetical protein [Acidobacteriota bacterium]
EAFNVLNEQSVVGGNTTVLTRWNAGAASGLVPFDPFNVTPQEGLHYRLHDSFGQPTGKTSYQDPRSYRFSVGLRF